MTKVRFHPSFSSFHQSEACPEFQTRNCCASQKQRHKIKSGTQEGNQTLSSHAVFCCDIVQSCGCVATTACHNDETCTQCKQSCQQRCEITSALLVKHQSRKVSFGGIVTTLCPLFVAELTAKNCHQSD